MGNIMSARVKNRFPMYQAKAIARSQLTLRAMANDIVRLSKMQVPIDTGRLQSSGHYTGGGKSYTISYATPYARRWHFEDANFQRGRKSHYLSDPAELIGRGAAAYFKASRALS